MSELQDTTLAFERPAASAPGEFGARMGKFVLAYALLIAYVSWLPLDVGPISFRWAWRSFMDLPFLGLNFSGRIEAIPCLLLYFPLGFLMGAWLLGLSRRSMVLIVGVALSLFFCAAIACCVEFFQQFFPPRFVSLNDIYAEFAGGAMGVGVWLLFGPRLRRVALRIAARRAALGACSPATNGFARRLIAVMALPYFLGIAWLNGWFSESWQSLSLALVRLSAVPVLPFYYQSNLEVPAVLVNMVFQVILYWPVGVAIWFWQKSRGADRSYTGSPVWSGIAVAAFAAFIELGKLFLLTRQPNSSNVLVAVAIAIAIHWLLEKWYPSAARSVPEAQTPIPFLCIIHRIGGMKSIPSTTQ